VIRIAANPPSDFLAWLLGDVDGRRVLVHGATGDRYIAAKGDGRYARGGHDLGPADEPAPVNRHQRRAYRVRLRRAS
jgi:hypothetical protein